MTIKRELGFSNIIFEGDRQRVVNATNFPKDSRDELTPIIHDIHFMMQQSQGWQVHFHHRETNRVAHNLAKIACSLNCEKVWMEKCPSLILNMVLEDKLCNVL